MAVPSILYVFALLINVFERELKNRHDMPQLSRTYLPCHQLIPLNFVHWAWYVTTR